MSQLPENGVENAKNFTSEGNNKNPSSDIPSKQKPTEALQNLPMLVLPQSSNIKNFGLNLVKTQVANKEAEANIDQVNSVKKKQIELITSVFLLGYNQIRDLAGLGKAINLVMYDSFERLQWIDLQHNYLTSVSVELGTFENLKTLYLHANFIPSIKDFTNLRGLKNLRNLTVHGNPLVRIPNFRLYFIDIFPSLRKLDTVLISKKERDNSRVLFNEFKNKVYPVYDEEDLPLPPPIKDPNNKEE